MTFLRDIPLLQVSVRDDAGFLDAARVLLASRISAIAVLDGDDHVVGLFTDDDLLRGLFPAYLEELHHTAFLVNDNELVQARAEFAAGQSVGRFISEPIAVEVDAGRGHLVERFLHTPWGAVAVVENRRFLGMINQLDFTERLMRHLELPP